MAFVQFSQKEFYRLTMMGFQFIIIGKKWWQCAFFANHGSEREVDREKVDGFRLFSVLLCFLKKGHVIIFKSNTP